jgi:hypothetical protein
VLRRGWLGARAELTAVLELAALVAFAITQPVLDRFGRAPDVFLFEQADRLDVVLFAMIFSVLPVVVLWLVELGVGCISPMAREVLHTVFVAIAAGLVAVNLAKLTTSASGLPVAVFAIVVAVLFGFAYVRARPTREFLRFASAALVFFVALFLFVSPVSSLVRTGTVDVEGDVALDRRPPVIMLVLDELPLASLVDRSGRIDEELYPGFARLAAHTTWYRNATAVSPTTWYSVPSSVTGHFPTENALPVVSQWPGSLFTLFGSGYRYDVQEAITGMCPTARCDREGGGGLPELVDRAVNLYGDVVTPEEVAADPQATFIEGDDPDIEFDAFDRFQPDRFSRFLDGLRDEHTPGIHYLHLLLPHTPWRLFPSGMSYARPERSPGQADAKWTAESEWPALQARQRHLLQVQYVDGLVNQFMDRLEQSGLLDTSVVVVMADHGVAFRPGQPVKGNKEKEVVDAITPEMAWVPLFVRVPGGAGGQVDDRNAMLVDILPTIAEVVGLELPANDGERGQSLLGPARPSPTKLWFQAHDSDFFGVNAGSRSEFPSSRRAEAFALGAGAWGTGTDRELRLFAIGPRRDLVGEGVSALELGQPSTVGAEVDIAPFFGAVNRSTGVVPAMIEGELSGDVEPASAVALALNGRIGAVSPVFPDVDAPNAFVGLLPEAWFRDGKNDLQLYLVSTTAGDRTARPVAITGG